MGQRERPGLESPGAFAFQGTAPAMAICPMRLRPIPPIIPMLPRAPFSFPRRRQPINANAGMQV